MYQIKYCATLRLLLPSLHFYCLSEKGELLWCANKIKYVIDNIDKCDYLCGLNAVSGQGGSFSFLKG